MAPEHGKGAGAPAAAGGGPPEQPPTAPPQPPGPPAGKGPRGGRRVPELPQWSEGVYLIEPDDWASAGPGGTANLQAEQLAGRTAWLRRELEELRSELESLLGGRSEWEQDVPAQVWAIPHGFPGPPRVAVIIEGEEWLAEVRHPNAGVVEVVHNEPRTGRAILTWR